MEKTKWHLAFHAAMRLELGDEPKLDFTEDFKLNEEPFDGVNRKRNA